MGQSSALIQTIFEIMLISLRAGALWMFFPVFGNTRVPAMVRLAGALTLSTALHSAVKASLPHWSLTQGPHSSDLIAYVAREFAIGAGMGLAARWIFSSIMSSAHWVGMQMGFSAGGVLDPEFQSSDTSWAELQNWMALVLFFGVGGHLLMIQAVADSYAVNFSSFFERLTGSASLEFWLFTTDRFFRWMLRLSGPMVVVLLLLQAAMGILSKFIPQINIWTVSIPVTIGAGVMLFMLLSPMYGDALGSLFSFLIEDHYLWFKAMGTR